MPTYALGRPLPSPPPCAHGGGGVQKAQEKLTGRSPCFSGAVGGATVSRGERLSITESVKGERGVKIVQQREKRDKKHCR